MRINVYLPTELAEEYALVKDSINLSSLVQMALRLEIDALKALSR